MNNLEKYLGNFPKRTEDTFERLQAVVGKRLETVRLREREKARLEQELSVVKETGTAGEFLFFYDTVYALKEYGAVFHGVMHCSYLCYLLGLTRVNPFWYGLPFARYFGKNRTHLPYASLVVKKGEKGRVIRYWKERYGADKIARVQDEEDEYIISSRSLLRLGTIERTLLRASTEGENVWHEDISSITWREASRLGLYTLTLQETEIGAHRRYSERGLYERVFLHFPEHRFADSERYQGVKEAEKIFAETGGNFVFQEQFYEICEKLLGVDGEKADAFRKDLAKRKKREMEEIRALFSWRLGEEGVALFNYLVKHNLYAVSKAYLIGLTFLKLL